MKLAGYGNSASGDVLLLSTAKRRCCATSFCLFVWRAGVVVGLHSRGSCTLLELVWNLGFKVSSFERFANMSWQIGSVQ